MLKNLKKSIRLAEKANFIIPQAIDLHNSTQQGLIKNNTFFYLGTTVLNELLQQTTKELAEVENLKFTHDPVLIYPEEKFKVSLPLVNYLVKGLIVGLCLSFLTIFLLIVSKNRY